MGERPVLGQGGEGLGQEFAEPSPTRRSGGEGENQKVFGRKSPEKRILEHGEQAKGRSEPFEARGNGVAEMGVSRWDYARPRGSVDLGSGVYPGIGVSSDDAGEPRRPFKWKATGGARLCISRRRGAEFLRPWGVAGDENVCGRVSVPLI